MAAPGGDKRPEGKKTAGKKNVKEDLQETRNWTTTQSTFKHPRLRIWLSQGGVHRKPIIAMLDSGSSISTISPETVRKLGLTTRANTLPSTIRNADGSNTKGGWKENVSAWVDTGVSNGKMRIAVVATHDDRFLLGNDWIQRYKPTIDWATGRVSTKFGRTKLLGTSHLRKALEIISRRKKKKIERSGQTWWKTDASKSCVDSDSDSESEYEITVAPTTKDSKTTIPEISSKTNTPQERQQIEAMQRSWETQNQLAIELKERERKAKKAEEQDQQEDPGRLELGTIGEEISAIDAQIIATNPVYGAVSPKEVIRTTSGHSPSSYKKRKTGQDGRTQRHQATAPYMKRTGSKTDEEGSPGSLGGTPVVGRRRIVQVRDIKSTGIRFRRRWTPAKGKKNVKEYFPKVRDKADQLRKKLTKISSVAQKYSQEKAAAQGRTVDAPKKTLGEMLPRELWGYKDRFDEQRAKRLPKSNRWDMTIEFEEGKPLPGKQPIYPLSPEEKEAVEEFLRENLEKGWIRQEHKGEFVIASPVFFVGKKDGGARMVIDYRAVNKICKPDPFPIPLMHTLPDELKRAKYFTTLDMRAGYNNIRIRPEDEAKAGFRTHQGVYIPRVMQFGMMNSPAVFQRAMNQIFDDMIGRGILIYLDDIIIYAETEEALWKLTIEVMERLRSVDFYLKLEKCFFNLQELDYLGFVVSREGLKVDNYKVKAVQEWPELKTKRDIRKFIGFANFYRKFIEGYSTIARPLTTLLSKKRTFTWGEHQRRAFERLKHAFISAPVLVRPDYEKQFIIETDASLVAMGAVLSQQQDDGSIKPISFWSGTFNAAERNYGVGDRELLAIICGLISSSP